MGEFTGLVAVVMVFGIPIAAILAGYFTKKNKLKAEMIKDQLELERIKQENFLLETEKMRLELEKMQLDSPKDKINF